jgi:hypothetical protein
MNPTPAEMLKGIPLDNKATIPPVAASGILRKIRIAGMTS